MHRKIIFELEQDDVGYPPVNAEGVWATPAGENRFVIDNIPFFTYEATLGDVVEATEHQEALLYKKTIKPSGGSLLRVIYYKGTDPTELREKLLSLGCSTEWDKNHRVIAIAVPEEAKLEPVRAFLQDGLQRDLWDYEEAIVRH